MNMLGNLLAEFQHEPEHGVQGKYAESRGKYSRLPVIDPQQSHVHHEHTMTTITL